MTLSAQFRGALVLAVVSGLACSAPSPYGSVSGTGRHGASTAAGSTSGSGSSSGTTSGSTTGMGGATSGQGTTSGSTGSNCFPSPLDAGFIHCSENQAELFWTAFVFGSNVPIRTAGATVINALNPSELGTFDDCGDFYLCASPGEQVVLSFGGPNYFPTQSQQIAADRSVLLPDFLLMYPTAVTELIGPQVPDFDPTKAMVAANVESSRCPQPGWTLALSDMQGQAIDAGLVYINGSILQAGTATLGEGAALFYNLDPKLQTVVLSSQYTGSETLDGGCVNEASEYELTDVTPVAASTITFSILIFR